jgi:hypothetical protein
MGKRSAPNRANQKIEWEHRLMRRAERIERLLRRIRARIVKEGREERAGVTRRNYETKTCNQNLRTQGVPPGNKPPAPQAYRGH